LAENNTVKRNAVLTRNLREYGTVFHHLWEMSVLYDPLNRGEDRLSSITGKASNQVADSVIMIRTKQMT